MLGIILGLMVGVGLAFLREYLDRTLRTEEDIQRHLDLPVLGIIPEAEAGKSQNQHIAGVAETAAEILNAKYRPRSTRARNLRRVFLDRHAPNSGFAETYRTLRTNIHFCRMDKPVKSIVLTSAVRAEGKSVTTANMAFASAQAGMSVLMIDADLRKPTLSNLIPSSPSPGLTGLLSDVFIHIQAVIAVDGNMVLSTVTREFSSTIILSQDDTSTTEKQTHFINAK